MTLESFLSRLQRVRRNGDGFLARCPAHEDHSPSLSIRNGHDGRILFYCFAGCTIEAICAALQIKVSDLFYKPRAPRQSIPRSARNVERQLSELRSRLTPRERVSSVTVVLCSENNLEQGMARALALAVEGEIVQAVLKKDGTCE